MEQLTEVTIEAVDLAAWAADALEVQAVAFGLSDEEVAVRLQIVARHAEQPGVLAFGAFADRRLVGFGYGMPNRREHWWSTVIEPHLEAQGHGDWLDDVFAVTELHVLPEYQGQGVGSALIRTLCEQSGQPRSILSAIDAETPARRLYRALGYRDLARMVRFPNTFRPYAVMGAQLPLRQSQSANSR
ncbi:MULTISPECIES: GNAT family N-acetyltransferase [unclassified Kitasatospora]|uniref:GNAT family N-acetyltransferase n=1 Tax=unclassified Kitasatospora TaxID=2633591 RepID=UPI00070C83B4|nr:MULTISPECIES: GNAT family N-acetyltransferase [unclassified Kitasatospora]KQV16135.1 acetyltransferase [Kitasatospora sp. Root107]KRB69643.1 acetyltransferase [Kitasatospora sp. Root187]